MNIPLFAWTSGATIVAVLLIAGLTRAADPHPSSLNSKALFAMRNYIESALNFTKKAEQDADLTQRLTDICFGLAYVNAARMLASDVTIEDKCGVKVDELFGTLRAQQQQCLTEMDQK